MARHLVCTLSRRKQRPALAGSSEPRGFTSLQERDFYRAYARSETASGRPGSARLGRIGVRGRRGNESRRTMRRFLRNISVLAVAVAVPSLTEAQASATPVTVTLMGGAAM